MKNIAESVQEDILGWMQRLRTPKEWRGHLRRLLVQGIVEKKVHKSNWKDWMMKYIQPQLVSRYPGESKVISTVICKHLGKSPLEDFLKAYA